MSKRPLGLVELPDKTIDFDLILLQRYQEFSAELLRVSLIGISAIGFVVSHMLLRESAKAEQTIELIKLPTVTQWC
jgi:hypothetical protein